MHRSYVSTSKEYRDRLHATADAASRFLDSISDDDFLKLLDTREDGSAGKALLEIGCFDQTEWPLVSTGGSELSLSDTPDGVSGSTCNSSRSQL